MEIRAFHAEDEEALAGLVAAFRNELAVIRGRSAEAGPEDGRDELRDYFERGYPVFVAEGDGKAILGYIVCRVDAGTVWAESLYVIPEARRMGVASMLYGEAELLARDAGGGTVYNWVDPENEAAIAFLGGLGYDVLNLVELRGAMSDETPERSVRVGGHVFRR